MNLNELRDRAYKNACDKGFYSKERSDEHYLCLVITELCEAIQADRVKKRANIEKFNWFQERSSDPDKMFNADFKIYILSTVEDELADAVIRLLSFAGYKKKSIVVKRSDIEYEKRFNKMSSKSFTEIVYQFIMLISEINGLNLIAYLFAFAEYLEIDLMKHIELKMKYNQTRSAMHGKKY